MPSTITHAYIGIDTLKKLNNKPKELIKKRIDNYKIYCQSTDVLYFYKIFLLKSNKIQKLGHTFHNKNTFKSFNYLIEKNKENKDNELFTLISGFITHYIADSTMHPYINYLSKSNDKLTHANMHFEIETYLDNYFINKYETKDYQVNKHYKLIQKYQKQEIIRKTLNEMFENLFQEKNIGNCYYKALKEMQFTYKYIRNDKTGVKKKIYQLIDHNHLKVRRTKYLSFHFPLNNSDYYLNLNHKEWHNIKKETLKSNKSFLDLYEDVIKKASNIINNLYEYVYENKNIDLEKLIGNNSYSTGLPLK